MGAVNDGLRSRLSVMENHVRNMGKKVGCNWRLANMNNSSIFIEDISNDKYYIANHSRQGNDISITDIKPIKLVESKKRSVFEDVTLKLVNAIAEGDQKLVESSINRLAANGFSSRSVPISGYVKTLDNITRHIAVSNDKTLDESAKKAIVRAVVESTRNKIKIVNGMPVEGKFTSQPLNIPISDWTAKKAIARRGREMAMEAYWSEGFQNRVAEVASLVTEDKIDEAVKKAGAFLEDKQEFTLLNRAEMKTLIGNTLATKVCFNQKLTEDVAELFYRTNTTVNKQTILKEWRAIGQKSGNSAIIENVEVLKTAKNFDDAYNTFVNMIFTEESPREIQAQAYATALTAIKDTPQVKKSNELTGKIDELLERLENSASDHAVISEVEDLLSEVKSEVNSLKDLDNFDSIPGDDSGDSGDLLDSKESPVSNGKTVVNFNINISDDGVETNSDEPEEEDSDLADLLKDDDSDEDEDEGDDDSGIDLGNLGGDEDEEDEDKGNNDIADLLKGESLEDRPAINEDPYSTNNRVNTIPNASGYGSGPIKIEEDTAKVVQTMIGAVHRLKLNNKAIVENVRKLAIESMKTHKILVPKSLAESAVEQVINLFFEEIGVENIGIKKLWEEKTNPFAKKNKKDKNDKKSKKGSPVKWLQKEEYGAKGVQDGRVFIIDHNGQNSNTIVIMNENGLSEVPVPGILNHSALASVGLVSGNPKPFEMWLSDQLPTIVETITDEDVDNEINEALINIQTTPDGGVTVSVDADDVSIDDGTGQYGEGDDLGLDGMEEIDDSISTSEPFDDEEMIDDEEVATDDEITDVASEVTDDFVDDQEHIEDAEEEAGEAEAEAEEDAESAEEEAEEAEEDVEEAEEETDEDDDEEITEDRDITDPSSSDYSKPEKPSKKKHKIKDSGDDLDGITKSTPSVSDTSGVKMKKVD